MLTVGSLCTGYGGIELALRLAGWPVQLVWVADNDPGAAALLAHRHPDVPNHGDITAVDWATVERVDLLTAGFPCQDLSVAGLRRGLRPGTRSGVWSHVVLAIDALRPSLVVLENVEGILSAGAHSDLEPCPWCVGTKRGGDPQSPLRALGAVLGDLADLGYDAVWTTLAASDVGACHRRRRVFVLAWPADATRLGHGHPWAPGREGVPVAAVGGTVRPAGVAELLPTPNAALGRGTGFPSPKTARDRMDRGTRCLDDAVALLPTPRANDARGVGVHGDGGADLRTSVSLLPTPRARDHKGRDPNPRGVDLNEALALLPTPRATDGSNGGPNQRGSSGDLMLPSAVVQLLPTPTAADGERASATYERGNPTLIGALLPTPVAHNDGKTPEAHLAMKARMPGGPRSQITSLAVAVQAPDRWGQYAPAIARWERVIGRPAPDPTEPGRNGQPRLSARFVEWMQGLPDGWVTGVPGLSRNQMLRLLGNGVVPSQCAAAVTHLSALVEAITGEPIEPAGAA